MANIEDCPGFETFGSDVKAARQAKRISRKAMAEKVNIDWRYLANIENEKPWLQERWLLKCLGCGQFLDLMSKDVRRKK